MAYFRGRFDGHCVLKTTAVLMCTLQIPFALAHPISPYDPAGYFYEKYLHQEAESREDFQIGNYAVRQEDVTIDAIPYVKYSIGKQALYLQKVFSSGHDDDAEFALVDCKRSSGDDPKPTFTKRHRIRLEAEVREGVRFDLTIVNKIVISACNGQPLRYNANSEPMTLGISWDGDDGKIYRIFNQGFAPNLGFGVQF